MGVSALGGMLLALNAAASVDDRIVVVGAGISGLAAALELSRAGLCNVMNLLHLLQLLDLFQLLKLLCVYAYCSAYSAYFSRPALQTVYINHEHAVYSLP